MSGVTTSTGLPLSQDVDAKESAPNAGPSRNKSKPSLSKDSVASRSRTSASKANKPRTPMIPFKPEKYPIIFDSFSDPPKVIEPILPEPTTLPEFSQQAHDVLTRSAKWAKIAAEIFQADLPEVSARELTIGATLFTCSSFLLKHEQAGYPETQFNSLKNADVSLPSYLATALSQFGELHVPINGSRYEVPDADLYTRHLIRAASFTRDQGEQEAPEPLNVAYQNWWTPAQPIDAITELAIALYLHRHVRTRASPLPWLNVRDWRPFSGAEPPWWPLVFDEANQNQLDWLNEARPAALATWFEPRPDLETRYASLARIGVPTTDNWNAQFSGFTLGQTKAAISVLLQRWHAFSPTLNQAFVLVSSQQQKGTQASPALLGSLTTQPENMLAILRHELLLDASQATLFAAFPAKCLYFF